MLLLAILYLCGVVLHLSTRVSSLANQTRTLAQHVARLEMRQDAVDGGPAGDGDQG